MMNRGEHKRIHIICCMDILCVSVLGNEGWEIGSMYINVSGALLLLHRSGKNERCLFGRYSLVDSEVLLGTYKC